MNQATIDFLHGHADADPIKLLFQQERYPGVDMRFVAEQLEGRRQTATKWPMLSEQPDFYFPPKLNCEQSSSQMTAEYKAAHFATARDTVADITGGMGIDSIAFARKCAKVNYCEQDAHLVELMQHNCKILALENIDCHCGDCIKFLEAGGHYDLIFADPARRDAHGRKVAAFEDCSPNLLKHKELLLERGGRLLVKASPMIDLTVARQQLGDVEEIHILSHRGECKEVLFYCKPDVATVKIHCVLLQQDDFCFTPEEEASARTEYCTEVGKYLYEPDGALLKGGPFNLIGQRYCLAKLGRNSHLYTSDNLVQDFPGRMFRVVQPIALNRKGIQQQLPDKKAHVVCRNYPMVAAQLQQQLGLKEGGGMFIIATTIAKKPVGFLCERIINNP